MASAKSCENALKDITFYVILNLANLGTVNFIKLTWFIAIYIMRAWIAQLIKTFIKCNEPIECIYVNLFGPTEWFGTPTWPPRSHVKMLLRILPLK